MEQKMGVPTFIDFDPEEIDTSREHIIAENVQPEGLAFFEDGFAEAIGASVVKDCKKVADESYSEQEAQDVISKTVLAGGFKGVAERAGSRTTIEKSGDKALRGDDFLEQIKQIAEQNGQEVKAHGMGTAVLTGGNEMHVALIKEMGSKCTFTPVSGAEAKDRCIYEKDMGMEMSSALEASPYNG